MASFRDGMYMSSMTKMHKTAKKARSPTKTSRNASMESSTSSRRASIDISASAGNRPTAAPRQNITYEAEDVIAEEHRQTAREARGLTMRDMMNVTVPYRNQAGNHRMQDMTFDTGAGYSDPRRKLPASQTSPNKKEYFANSYMPPGMSPPKLQVKQTSTSTSSLNSSFSYMTSSSSTSSKSLSLSELKKMAIQKQLADQEEREALKRGELRRRKNAKKTTNGHGGRRRRSFNEGSNARLTGSSSRLRSSRRSGQSSTSSPASKRTGSNNEYDDESTVPQTTRYVYPNERRMTNLNHIRQAPQVPPSRRKTEEAKEERSFRNGGMASQRQMKNQEAASVQAQLKVEQILADAARGKNPHGSWGRSKPPKKFYPTGSMVN